MFHEIGFNKAHEIGFNKAHEIGFNTSHAPPSIWFQALKKKKKISLFVQFFS